MPRSLRRELAARSLTLPTPSSPGGAYESVVLRGAVAYLAVQFPIRDGEWLYRGRLGANLTTVDGRAAAELCALNVLSQLSAKLPGYRLVGLNHLDIRYVAAAGWDEGPRVADGASELLRAVLGDAGRHTRALAGAAHLPAGFAVGVTASATVARTAGRAGRNKAFTRRTRR